MRPKVRIDDRLAEDEAEVVIEDVAEAVAEEVIEDVAEAVAEDNDVGEARRCMVIRRTDRG